jgi:hypothetical protein
MADIFPKLTLNALLLQDFIKAQAPCFAMGYVQVAGKTTGFLALRPEYQIPNEATQGGFNFGHSVFGSEKHPLFHFVFEFYDHSMHNVLIDPANPIASAVMQTMVKEQDYFFFAINPDQNVVAFRADMLKDDAFNLKAHLEKYAHIDPCPVDQYEKTSRALMESDEYQGVLLEWVCRDNMEYLNMKDYPFEATPR